MNLSRKILLHDSFRVGIVLKGIDGLMETAGAAVVWMVQPTAAEQAVRSFFRHELEVDPHDFLAHLMITASHEFAGARWYASIFLLSHGLMKLVLVVALWWDRRWAYPAMIVMLCAFSVWQTDRFFQTHSAFLALLTVFDLLFAALTWWEYREQKKRMAESDGQGGD